MSRSISRQQLYRLGEPLGDSATRTTATGKRIYGGGGSGGGSGQRDATMEERRLWDAQASSLEQMNAVAMPMLTTGMGNMGVMANEAMDGTLSSRLRNMAGVDASQAMGQGLAAASRGLERYGSTMNPNALGATMNAAGLEGAKMKSNAMNMANTAAEDVKWQRNAALTSLASGQGSSSVSGMGTLAGQIGQSRQASNAAAANEQAANNQALSGLGMGLANIMKADGGEIRLKDGGDMQSFQRPSSFQSAPRVGGFDSTKEDEDGGGIMATLQPVLTPLAIQEAGKVVVPAVKSLMGGAGAGMTGAGITVPASGGIVASSLANAGTGAGLGAVGGTGAGLGATGMGGGLSLAGGTGVGAGVGGGIGAGAGGAAGMGASSLGGGLSLGAGATGVSAGATGVATTTAATNAWNPVGWAAAAYLAGSALDLWADGGDVGERKDMRPGGHVRGPGTETSDSIPALLSDNEFVNNADSVKLPRNESKQVVQTWLEEGGTTKELLNEINNAGLRKRGKPPQPIAESKNGEVRALSGGLAALGHIARGYVPTAMEIERNKENNRRWDAGNDRDTQRFDWERKRAESELSLLDINSDNKRKEAEVKGLGLDLVKEMQPIEHKTKINNAEISKTLSQFGVEDLPRVISRQRAQGVLSDTDASIASVAKIGDLIELGDSSRVISFMNNMNQTIPKEYQSNPVTNVGVEKDKNGGNVFVARDANGNDVMRMSAGQLSRIRNSIGKSEFKTVNAGDSLVQIKGGVATPVYTAPESAKSAAAKQGPLERDVGYLVNQHGMSKDQALAHLNSAKTMTREQFILKSVQDSIAMGKKPTSEEVTNFGTLYDSARQAPAASRNAPAPASNSPAPANLDPQIKSLLGIP